MLKLKNIYGKNLYIIIICTLLTSSVSTLEAKTEDDRINIRDEAPVLKGSIDTEKEERKYIYNPVGKTDPFKSFIVVQEEKADKKKEKPRTYLETLELSQLSLSVIVIGKKGKWAMVKDSKDDGHVIREGTPIGTNGGVVYKIKPGEVVIREEFTNFKGEKEFRDVSKKTSPDRL